MLKQQKGVTLVALVITIIVLLILAGVSIAMLTGDNGLLTKAKESVSETSIAEDREAAALDLNAAYAAYLDDKYSNGNTDNFTDWLEKNKTSYMKDTAHYTLSDDATTVTTKSLNKGEKTEKATISEEGGFVKSADGKVWSETTE